MAESKILKLAGSSVGRPNSEEKFFFFDTDNENRLTSKDINGVVEVYSSGTPNVINIPAVFTEDITINSNEIGLNITGGYDTNGFSLIVSGNGTVNVIGVAP